MRITEFPILREIKDEYATLRQEGVSRSEAVTKLKHYYNKEIVCGAEDDGLLFWVGLADAQYSLKELSDEEAKRGLIALNQLENKGWQIAAGDIVRRYEWYAKAPMPERKKVNQSKRFQCSWKAGDTFAYQFLGKDAEKLGLLGRYVIFRKVCEVQKSNGVIHPIVTISIWDDVPLPTSAEEYQRVPILRLINGHTSISNDKFIYRAEMLIDNEKELSQLHLKYLGNFAEVEMPTDEIVIEYVGCMVKLPPNLIESSCCNYWRRHQFYSK